MNTKVVNCKVKFIRPQYDNLEEWTRDLNNVYILESFLLMERDIQQSHLRFVIRLKRGHWKRE
jgi:hypothetical protein